ncbi:BOL3 BolA-like protein 3 [Candida maltosa Xu316]
MGDYEKKIYTILKDEFDPSKLQVQDVSGGCGSMFAILVESSKFKGLPMIKQHRLVNEILKDEIKQWHGLQLRTKGV